MSQKQYKAEWFNRRAFESIKRLDEGVWDFSDSLLLYLPQSAKEYESIQETDTSYFHLVTQPEKQYLKNISSSIVKELPNEFAYIDLGPGTEHKEQYIFDEAKIQGKKFTYIPVDINEHFLDIAREYAEGQKIQVKSVLSSFEGLP